MTCTIIDLSKAFDTVDGRILIKQCRAYGREQEGNREKMIRMYLKDWFQYVVV